MKFDPSITQTRYDSPLGPMIVAATRRGLAGVWFEGQRHLPQTDPADRGGTAEAGGRRNAASHAR